MYFDSLLAGTKVKTTVRADAWGGILTIFSRHNLSMNVGCDIQLTLDITVQRVLEKILRKAVEKNRLAHAYLFSGPRGVGKTTVSANLAYALALKNYKVGLLDADIYGPDVPIAMGIKEKFPMVINGAIVPFKGPLDVRVMSIQFLLEEESQPVIWRGPLKSSAIRQFLAEVVWGPLEYLLIDLPPGTGDEALTVIQSIPKVDGAIIVTIPSEVSELVVKKAVEFARRLNTPILGIVENMAEFRCPKCGAVYQILRSGAGERIAEQMGVRLLGKIPLDPTVSETSDAGKPIVASDPQHPIAKTFMKIAEEIDSLLKASS